MPYRAARDPKGAIRQYLNREAGARSAIGHWLVQRAVVRKDAAPLFSRDPFMHDAHPSELAAQPRVLRKLERELAARSKMRGALRG
jgi:hypothetical protein